MTTRELILDVIARIRADRALVPVLISDDDLLGEKGLGLDSLDLATLVANLDVKLKHDPFANGNPRFETVGEFVSLYDGRGDP